MLEELDQKEVVRQAAAIHEKKFGTQASEDQLGVAFFLMRQSLRTKQRKEEVLALLEEKKASETSTEVARACNAVIWAFEKLLAETN